MSDRRKEMAELRNALRLFVRAGARTMTDDEALSVSSLHEIWKAGRVFGENEVDMVVRHGDRLYRIVTAHTAQAHQPPDAEGMLAVYRPIDTTHTGTVDDPIPWVYGMDCSAGNYYSYDGKTWLCGGDMKPCVWAPGTAGVWQWAEVTA